MLVSAHTEGNGIEELYLRYAKRMYAIAYKILHDPHDSEDAVMEAFRRIVKNQKKFNNLKSTDADALATVYIKNAAIDVYNLNKKRVSSPNYYSD